MNKIAVVAHSKKQLGGGLNELRELLAAEGVADPLWYEVPKSKHAPKAARKAKEAGAELVLVWGGDGTVQRCIDALAGSGVAIGDPPRRYGKPARQQPRHPDRPRVVGARRRSTVRVVCSTWGGSTASGSP